MVVLLCAYSKVGFYISQQFEITRVVNCQPHHTTGQDKSSINLYPSELLPETCMGGFIFERSAQCALRSLVISKLGRSCSRNSGENRTFCGSLSTASNGNSTKVLFNLLRFTNLSSDVMHIAIAMMCTVPERARGTFHEFVLLRSIGRGVVKTQEQHRERCRRHYGQQCLLSRVQTVERPQIPSGCYLFDV